MDNAFEPELTDEQVANRLSLRLRHLHALSKLVERQGFKTSDDVHQALKRTREQGTGGYDRLPSIVKNLVIGAFKMEDDIMFLYDDHSLNEYSFGERLHDIAERCTQAFQHVLDFGCIRDGKVPAGIDSTAFGAEGQEMYNLFGTLRKRFDDIIAPRSNDECVREDTSTASLFVNYTLKALSKKQTIASTFLSGRTVHESDDIFFEYSPRPLQLTFVHDQYRPVELDVERSVRDTMKLFERRIPAEQQYEASDLLRELLLREYHADADVIRYWSADLEGKILLM